MMIESKVVYSTVTFSGDFGLVFLAVRLRKTFILIYLLNSKLRSSFNSETNIYFRYANVYVEEVKVAVKVAVISFLSFSLQRNIYVQKTGSRM